MRNFHSLVLAFGLIWFLPVDTAVGQLIRIFNNGGGGVDIRVPFVRVQTNGYGGSHVRAPFVNVQSPPYYRGQPYYVQPGQPTYVQPQPYGNYAPSYTPSPSNAGGMNNGAITPGASPVQPATAIVPEGQPATARPIPNSVPIPAAKPVRRGPEMANPAAGDSANGSDRNAAPAAGSEMKSVLAGPGEADGVFGLRQRLIADARDLNQSLTTYSNARLWQDYLQLPTFVTNGIDWLEPGAVTQEQVDQLAKTLRRFETTGERQDLQLINQFDSFQRVRNDLAELIGSLNDESRDNPEELPAPLDKSGR